MLIYNILFGVGLEVKVEANVFGLFGVEVFIDEALGFFVDSGDAFDSFAFFSERDDVANFGFDTDAVAVFLGDTASEDSSGALEIAEGFGEGFVAATEDPVDDFAFAHDVEIVNGEVAAVNHRLDDVGEELHVGARFVAVIDGAKREVEFGEFGGKVGGLEGDFVGVVLVFEDGEVVVEGLDFVEIPDVVKFEAVG